MRCREPAALTSTAQAGLPTHAPALHDSFMVQGSLSLHGSVLFTCRHPVAGRQESSVQPFPSSQLGAWPGRHTPATQSSSPLQRSLSPQAIPSVSPEQASANTARLLPTRRSEWGTLPTPTGTLTTRGTGSAMVRVVDPPPSRLMASVTP